MATRKDCATASTCADPALPHRGDAMRAAELYHLRHPLPFPPSPHPRMIDLLEIDDFLDAETLADLVAELDRSAGRPSTVLSAEPDGTVHTMSRKSTRVAVSPETLERVKTRLMERKSAL